MNNQKHEVSEKSKIDLVASVNRMRERLERIVKTANDALAESDKSEKFGGKWMILSRGHYEIRKITDECGAFKTFGGEK